MLSIRFTVYVHVQSILWMFVTKQFKKRFIPTTRERLPLFVDVWNKQLSKIQLSAFESKLFKTGYFLAVDTNTLKKFLDSNWLKAVQFILNKVQKYLTKYKLQNNLQILPSLSFRTLLFENLLRAVH